jgi:hypothetical protein
MAYKRDIDKQLAKVPEKIGIADSAGLWFVQYLKAPYPLKFFPV